MKVINFVEFDPNERAYPFENGENKIGVEVTDDSVIFRGQRGPIGEVGENGCQVDDIIKFARITLQAYNHKFSCRENAIAITKLEEVEMWLDRRTRDRRERCVEGFNKK